MGAQHSRPLASSARHPDISVVIPALVRGCILVLLFTAASVCRISLTAACECRTRSVVSPRRLPGVCAAVKSLILIALYDEGNGFCSAQQTAPDRHCEVVVVDGGSKDRTVCIAKKMGAKVRMIGRWLRDTQDLLKELRDLYCLTCVSLQVLFSRPGRGLQMNLGWRHSNGDCVLFLHADSTLPSG